MDCLWFFSTRVGWVEINLALVLMGGNITSLVAFPGFYTRKLPKEKVPPSSSSARFFVCVC